jgi:hypothetical protein
MEISEDEEQASERLGPSVPFNLNLCLGFRTWCTLRLRMRMMR